MIIFTSDNGSRNDFGGSNGPLRGSKATTWEGGLRVPFIVHWKDHIRPGVNSGILTSMDLYPSLARLAGAGVPDDRIIDGIEMSDLLLGKTEESPRDTFFYYMCNNLEAVRVGDWKLHLCRRPNAGKPTEADRPAEGGPGHAESKSLARLEQPVRELYNLREDPGETRNVYDAHPGIVSALHQKAEACRCDIGDEFTRTAGQNIRPAGHVKNARPLTCYDPDHPYIVAMYDRNESG